MNTALSGQEILKLLDGRTKVLLYDDISRYSTPERLLQPYGSTVILYPTGENVGHWTALLYTVDDGGNRIIEFFDPYGISVDNEFKAMGHRHPHRMARLLLQSSGPVSYNQHKVQQFSDEIATCGRHCVLRICFKHLPLSVYWSLFGTHRGVTGDEIALALTQ